MEELTQFQHKAFILYEGLALTLEEEGTQTSEDTMNAYMKNEEFAQAVRGAAAILNPDLIPQIDDHIEIADYSSDLPLDSFVEITIANLRIDVPSEEIELALGTNVEISNFGLESINLAVGELPENVQTFVIADPRFLSIQRQAIETFGASAGSIIDYRSQHETAQEYVSANPDPELLAEAEAFYTAYISSPDTYMYGAPDIPVEEISPPEILVEPELVADDNLVPDPSLSSTFATPASLVAPTLENPDTILNIDTDIGSIPGDHHPDAPATSGTEAFFTSLAEAVINDAMIDNDGMITLEGAARRVHYYTTAEENWIHTGFGMSDAANAENIALGLVRRDDTLPETFDVTDPEQLYTVIAGATISNGWNIYGDIARENGFDVRATFETPTGEGEEAFSTALRSAVNTAIESLNGTDDPAPLASDHETSTPDESIPVEAVVAEVPSAITEIFPDAPSASMLNQPDPEEVLIAEAPIGPDIETPPIDPSTLTREEIIAGLLELEAYDETGSIPLETFQQGLVLLNPRYEEFFTAVAAHDVPAGNVVEERLQYAFNEGPISADGMSVLEEFIAISGNDEMMTGLINAVGEPGSEQAADFIYALAQDSGIPILATSNFGAHDIVTEDADGNIVNPNVAPVLDLIIEAMPELAPNRDEEPTAPEDVDGDTPVSTDTPLLGDAGTPDAGIEDVLQAALTEEIDEEPSSAPTAIDLSETADVGVLLNGIGADDMPYLTELAADAEALGVNMASFEAHLDPHSGHFVNTQTASIATIAYGEQFQAALANDGILDSAEYAGMLTNYFQTISTGIIPSGDIAATVEQAAAANVALNNIESFTAAATAASLTNPADILAMDPSQLETMLDAMNPDQLAYFQSTLLESQAFRNTLETRLDGDLSNGSTNLIESQQLMTAAGLYNRGIDGVMGSGTRAGISRFEDLPDIERVAPERGVGMELGA